MEVRGKEKMTIDGTKIAELHAITRDLIQMHNDNECLQEVARKGIKICCEEIIRLADSPDSEWHVLAREGQKIPAIKIYRQLYGVGLKDAKTNVEDWMRSAGMDVENRGWNA